MATESTILGMEKKKFFNTLMALFIILLFVGGSLIFLMGDYQNPDSSNPPASDPNAPAATTFPFESTNPVSGKVSQVFPVLLILAQTNNAQIDTIDAELFQKGAININSRYETGSENGSLTYRAEIQLPPTKSASDFLNTLRTDVNSLRQVQGAIRGMIQLDSVLPITMHNADLNLDQMYSPTDPFMTSLLSETTQKNDRVQILIRADFAGSVSSNIESYEVSNASSEPVSNTVTQTVTLDSIDPLLYLGGQ